jgi:ParB-like chromosome segregation protein Spo0J
VSGYDVRTLDIARLRPTEEVDAAHVRRIAEEMRRDGVQRRPILVERSSLAILDGHHRYHAAKTLGLAAINAVLIDYGDQRLTLSSWGETAMAAMTCWLPLRAALCCRRSLPGTSSTRRRLRP